MKYKLPEPTYSQPSGCSNPSDCATKEIIESSKLQNKINNLRGGTRELAPTVPTIVGATPDQDNLYSKVSKLSVDLQENSKFDNDTGKPPLKGGKRKTKKKQSPSPLPLPFGGSRKNKTRKRKLSKKLKKLKKSKKSKKNKKIKKRKTYKKLNKKKGGGNEIPSTVDHSKDLEDMKHSLQNTLVSTGSRIHPSKHGLDDITKEKLKKIDMMIQKGKIKTI